jgi:preprotein translocase subunit YajC
MTTSPALLHLLVAASKSGSNPLVTLLPLVAIGLLGYFFFIRPQQRKAQAARASQGSAFEVGDEVQTVGGVVGTVLETHGDRYTLLTGALGDDGNLDGPQPTRIVFVRQAIARKIEPIADVRVDDEPVEEVTDVKSATDVTDVAHPAKGDAGTAGTAGTADIDDVGGDGAAGSGGRGATGKGEHGGEAEEA